MAVLLEVKLNRCPCMYQRAKYSDGDFSGETRGLVWLYPTATVFASVGQP